MNIIFVKQYVGKESFDNWVTIEVGEEALLMDEVTGKIEISEGFAQPTIIDGIPSSCYALVRSDVD